MYRPTVRYDELYREYVDSLFHATTLDRNQIIRLALFTAAHSKEFHDVLSGYKRPDVPALPSAKWRPNQSGLWREQTYPGRGEKEDVNAVDRGKEDTGEATNRGNVRAAEDGRLAYADVIVRRLSGPLCVLNLEGVFYCSDW